VIAIEPWFLAARQDLYRRRRLDVCAAATAHEAHAEHTVAITNDGPLVLYSPLDDGAALDTGLTLFLTHKATNEAPVADKPHSHPCAERRRTAVPADRESAARLGGFLQLCESLL
jgi:hypothetical protein